jgi:hypothetical protein
MLKQVVSTITNVLKRVKGWLFNFYMIEVPKLSGYSIGNRKQETGKAACKHAKYRMSINFEVFAMVRT